MTEPRDIKIPSKIQRKTFFCSFLESEPKISEIPPPRSLWNHKMRIATPKKEPKKKRRKKHLLLTLAWRNGNRRTRGNWMPTEQHGNTDRLIDLHCTMPTALSRILTKRSRLYRNQTNQRHSNKFCATIDAAQQTEQRDITTIYREHYRNNPLSNFSEKHMLSGMKSRNHIYTDFALHRLFYLPCR